ncbi:hypothetical protein Q2941_47205 [Bradyrhizobium sp. UFLA05-153]
MDSDRLFTVVLTALAVLAPAVLIFALFLHLVAIALVTAGASARSISRRITSARSS